MENVFKMFLYPHIAGGFIALIVAPVAMIVKKGGSQHRLWGKVFFWSMLLVAISALGMSAIKSNIFLAMVGVFSFYLVASGYRALYRRKVNSFSDVEWVDWLLVTVSGLFCVGLILLGILVLLKNGTTPLGYIALVFGALGSRSVLNDIKSFSKADHHKENWMYHHMGGMIGGYIATVSAFSAVNMHFLPGIVQWLWPTFLGVPLLMFWISKYKKKKELSKKRIAV
ncbi:MAG TPA: DUF2306 domain-containing protein [Bacteroidia bacterium]|nr:DUF2306 domain-containing protein [Bacteroidia bacterium]